jgi:hypothetical protein
MWSWCGTDRECTLLEFREFESAGFRYCAASSKPAPRSDRIGIGRPVHTSAASGGSLKYQPYSGSDFTYTFTGASVAWISAKGPTRSNVTDIFMNGLPVKYDLDLTSSSTKYRRIVFTRNYASNANRTLYVRGAGRIGHSRLDIDGFVVLVIT